MSQALSEYDVESLLRAAGWRPGRRVPDALVRWQATLAEDGFVFHSAAEAVLLEFGGLVVGHSGPGAERARSVVRLDPALAFGERDRLQEYFGALRGRNVYPLGEVDDGHAFLAIAEDGEVVLIMDEVYDRWPTFPAALRDLLLGPRRRAV